MKIAVIGSRGLHIEDFSLYLPDAVDEIVSGGAKGIDAAVKAYAEAHGIPCTEFLPDYPAFGRAAPLRRNEDIVRYADFVLAFWDGRSRGTRYAITYCEKHGIPHRVVFLPEEAP